MCSVRMEEEGTARTMGSSDSRTAPWTGRAAGGESETHILFSTVVSAGWWECTDAEMADSGVRVTTGRTWRSPRTSHRSKPKTYATTSANMRCVWAGRSVDQPAIGVCVGAPESRHGTVLPLGLRPVMITMPTTPHGEPPPPPVHGAVPIGMHATQRCARVSPCSPMTMATWSRGRRRHGPPAWLPVGPQLIVVGICLVIRSLSIVVALECLTIDGPLGTTRDTT